MIQSLCTIDGTYNNNNNNVGEACALQKENQVME